MVLPASPMLASLLTTFALLASAPRYTCPPFVVDLRVAPPPPSPSERRAYEEPVVTRAEPRRATPVAGVTKPTIQPTISPRLSAHNDLEGLDVGVGGLF